MDAHSTQAAKGRKGNCCFGFVGRFSCLPAFGKFTLLVLLLLCSLGARQQTANFIVETPDPAFAKEVALTAEKYRHDLAVEWLGRSLPNWSQPCLMTVVVGPHLGAGGATSFVFDRGEVFGWRMTIQGSRERILDSVLPHEITHMIFASHFRRPLPRWADEGGATTVEHYSERDKHRRMLYQFLTTGRGIAFNQMFAMTEYPPDIMPLYAQGYSLAEFLIQIGGRRKYVEFLGDGLQSGNWSAAVARHYGISDLGVLQTTWLAWVKQGALLKQPNSVSPAAAAPLLAGEQRRPRPEPNLILRVRNPQQLPTTNPATNPVIASSASAPQPPLVPVRQPGGDSYGAAGMKVAEGRLTAAMPRSEPVPLPANGWRAAGKGDVAQSLAEPHSVPQPEAHSTTQLARPQDIQTPRQPGLPYPTSPNSNACP